MDWGAFFEAAALGRQRTVVAWQPSAVKGVASLVASRPSTSWKDYLRFHAIHEYADVLPRAFAEAAADMRARPSSRATQRALAITQSAMADAIGELYAARYFPSDAEGAGARASSPTSRRRSASTWHTRRGCRRPAGRSRWPSSIGCTSASAIRKRGRTGATFASTPTDAFGNAQRIADRTYRHALARLVKPYDPHEWVLTPQTAGALLNFQQNAYLFAAALLQPPKYDSTASDAAAYGAIGAIIGHDMSHFVDVLGADYEPDGRMRRWWTADDAAKFEAAAEPIVRQFSAYQPLPGLHVDGRLTRTENVADLAGLVAAFEAHREVLGATAADADRRASCRTASSSSRSPRPSARR